MISTKPSIKRNVAGALTSAVVLLTVLVTKPCYGEDAASCLNRIQRHLDVAMTSAGDAAVQIMHGDRASAADSILTASNLSNGLMASLEDASTEALLGKSSKKIRNAVKRFSAALNKATSTIENTRKKEKRALMAAIKAIALGTKIKKLMSKVPNDGPLVILEQRRLRLSKKEGTRVAFRVHVFGGGDPKVSLLNFGGSAGRIAKTETIAWSSQSDFTVMTGPDGGGVKVVAGVGGVSSAGFVFNLGPFLPAKAVKPQTTKTTATLASEVTNPDGWTVTSGVHDSGQGSATGTVLKAASGIPQLLAAADTTSPAKLLAVHMPGDAEVEISPASTALALAFTSPFLAAVCLEDHAAAKELIESLPEYEALAGWIAVNYQNGLTDERTRLLLGDLVSAAILSLPEPVFQRDLMIQPSDKRSGIEVTVTQENAGDQNYLEVTNSAARWVAAYVDEVAPVAKPGADFALVPATSLSLSVLSGSFFGTVSQQLNLSGDCTNARVGVYGPGFNIGGIEEFYDGEGARVALPFVMTVVDKHVLSVLQILTGIESLKNAPSGSAKFKHLISVIAKEFDQALPSDPLEVVEFVASVTQEMIEAFIDEDGALLMQICLEIGVDLAVNTAVAVLANFIPGVGQIWAFIKIAGAAANHYASLFAMITSRPKEVFYVSLSDVNNPPVIISGPSANPQTVEVGQVTSFDVLVSDLNGDPMTLDWDFGDGGTAITTNLAPATSHVYQVPGNYTATVAVSDGRGGLATGSTTVTVNPETQVASPTFAPPPGSYGSAQSVTISCSTSGSTIHFTTDGSTPTTASAEYTNAIGIAATTTIRAFAVKAGLTDSGVVSGEYTIGPSSGTAWSWGHNLYGQLGDGTTTDKASPDEMNGVANVTATVCGEYYSLILRSDGTVWGCGQNTSGQLGDGSETDRSTPVQTTGLASTKEIAAGGSHSLALNVDGTVWAWGRNNHGQLGDTTTTNRASVVQVDLLTSVKYIAAGGNHSLALKEDGTVWAWGYNEYGQLGDTTITDRLSPVQVDGLVNVKAISCGQTHSIALKTNGSVWAWGHNQYGRLGDETTTDRYSPVQVSGLSDVIAIAGGEQHSLALKSDGSVWSWGRNLVGQLGVDTSTTGHTAVPVQVSGLGSVQRIACGAFHSYATKTDGTAWTWGANGSGQLGDGTVSSGRFTPMRVSGLTGVIGIAAGRYHSLAVK